MLYQMKQKHLVLIKVNYCRFIIIIVFVLSGVEFILLTYSSVRVVQVFRDRKQLELTMKGIFIGLSSQGLLYIWHLYKLPEYRLIPNLCMYIYHAYTISFESQPDEDSEFTSSGTITDEPMCMLTALRIIQCLD